MLLLKYDQAGRFAASTMAVLTPADSCEQVGVMMEEYDAEVAACVMEHAEMTHRGAEAGAGGGVKAGGAGAGAYEIY